MNFKNLFIRIRLTITYCRWTSSFSCANFSQSNFKLRIEQICIRESPVVFFILIIYLWHCCCSKLNSFLIRSQYSITLKSTFKTEQDRKTNEWIRIRSRFLPAGHSVRETCLLTVCLDRRYSTERNRCRSNVSFSFYYCVNLVDDRRVV